MAAFGINPPASLPPFEKGGLGGICGEGGFLIYQENWLAVTVFVNLARCWRIDSMNGHYRGLIRSEIVSTLGLMGVKRKKHRALFDDLMVMESAALEVLNMESSKWGVGSRE